MWNPSVTREWGGPFEEGRPMAKWQVCQLWPLLQTQRQFSPAVDWNTDPCGLGPATSTFCQETSPWSYQPMPQKQTCCPICGFWGGSWPGSCPSHPGKGPLLPTQEPTRSHAWLGSSCSYCRFRNDPVTCHQPSQPQAWNTPAWTRTLQETCCPQPWRQACWPWSGCRY